MVSRRQSLPMAGGTAAAVAPYHTLAPDTALKRHRPPAMPRDVYMHSWVVCERQVILLLHPVEISFWSEF